MASFNNYDNSSSSDKIEKILSIRFNQDQSRFVCCTETGLRIYNAEPLAEEAHYKHSLVGSIGMAELLWRSNVVAMVGGGNKPKFAENRVLLYDDLAARFHVEIDFPTAVKAIRLRADRLVVALQTSIHVYSFPSFKILTSQDSGDNSRGLLEVTALSSAPKYLVAYPGKRKGSLALLDVATKDKIITNVPTIISAHCEELAYIALSIDGKKVATTCTSGTVIKVWDTTQQSLIVELRRGTRNAVIYSICFSADTELLCVSSDTGTIHVFDIKEVRNANSKYMMNSLASFGQIFASNYSFAQFSLPRACPCVCAFGSKNTIIVVCYDGIFYKYEFTKEGQCERKQYDKFLDFCNCWID